MKSPKMRVVLPALALVLVAAAVAGFLVVRAETATVTPPVQWTTFHDYFGLFTIRYPDSWTVYGGVTGGGHLPASAGGEYPFIESYFLTETAHPNYQIQITAIEIANSNERAYYCSDYRLGDTNGTFAGIPADNRGFDSLGLGYIGFGTGNGVFEIALGDYPGNSLQPLYPTSVPESQLQAEMAVYNPILSTFKPSSPQGITC